MRPLGWNLEELSNASTSHFTCDLMKETSENWSAGTGASGLTESGGWPTAITGGANVYYSVTTRIDQQHTDISEAAPLGTPHFPSGEYTVKCDGTVKVGIGRNGGDTIGQCSGTNSFTFTVPSPPSGPANGLEIRVYGGTITNTGDPHLFQVHPSGTNPAACDPATDTFNPIFIKALKGATAFRTLDWYSVYVAGTFNNMVDWADRTLLTARTWVSTNDTTGVGPPYEAAILLANEIYEETGEAVNPWVLFPVKSSDDFHTNFATYAAATLNAALWIGLEWGNETWNGPGGSFGDQYTEVLAQANTASLTGTDLQMIQKMTAQRSQEVWAIYETAFGGVTRLRRILGMQNKDCCFPSDAPTYLNHDPAGATHGAVSTDTDWAAFAPYYALGSTGHNKHSQNALCLTYDGVTNAQCGTTASHCTTGGCDCPGAATPFTCCATNSCVGIREWSPEQFCASMLVNVASAVQQFTTNVTAVEAFTNGAGNVVRAITYEGGDHADRVGGSSVNLTGEHDTTLVLAGHTANRHDCMETVTDTYLDALYAANHGHLLTMYKLISKMDRFRQFMFGEYLMDSNGDHNFCASPRYRGAFYWSQKP